MTITFKCPKCGNLCAFHSENAGRRAKCLKCWQVFIIPSEDGGRAEKVKIKTDQIEDGPFSGFYRAVFVGSWRLFIAPASSAALIFIIAVVCFKFFLGCLDFEFSFYVEATGRTITIPIPLGRFMVLTCWGCLFWYYMEMIYSTGFGIEVLPQAYIGGFRGFVWNAIRSVFVFFIALVAVQLPLLITFLITRKIGVEGRWLMIVLAIGGFFMFPMAILTFSISRDLLLLFRIDQFILTIVKAFRPYLLVASLVILAAALQYKTVGFSSQLARRGAGAVPLHLLANIAIQPLIIIAMRTIGLFYRHYSCFLRW